MLLSLDLGTTHSKAGVFNRAGDMLGFSRQPVIIHHDPSGFPYYDPEQLWSVVGEVTREATQGIDSQAISAIGIASMAETGLLVDKQSRIARTPLFPWHDTRAVHLVKELVHNRNPLQQFCRSGIRPNYKCSLAKLLWLRDNDASLIDGCTWLSTADYIAFRLTGNMGTDFSLAGRTYAFRLDESTWDEDWLSELGLPADLFPPAVPSGQPIGAVGPVSAPLIGLSPGTPVAICGHDHVCAAFAAAGTDPNIALDSMGTAEALVGSLSKKQLRLEEYNSGLVFGHHVAGDGYYWMGGLSASGGSLDWLRKILGSPALTYLEFEQLMNHLPPEPTGILYFPYLSGSGSPHTDIHVRGAFIGLEQTHDRPDFAKAVLEGTAFESEFIRRAAQTILKKEISSLKASGGGTNLSQWMQIKADVSGCEIQVLPINEATLLGAALVAGIGCGIFIDEGEARASLFQSAGEFYHPNQSRHRVYQKIYQEGYLALQEPLRRFSTQTASTSPLAKG